MSDDFREDFSQSCRMLLPTPRFSLASGSDKPYPCHYQGCEKRFCHETHARRHERQTHGLYRTRQRMSLVEGSSAVDGLHVQSSYSLGVLNQLMLDGAGDENELNVHSDHVADQ